MFCEKKDELAELIDKIINDFELVEKNICFSLEKSQFCFVN